MNNIVSHKTPIKSTLNKITRLRSNLKTIFTLILASALANRVVNMLLQVFQMIQHIWSRSHFQWDTETEGEREGERETWQRRTEDTRDGPSSQSALRQPMRDGFRSTDVTYCRKRLSLWWTRTGKYCMLVKLSSFIGCEWWLLFWKQADILTF